MTIIIFKSANITISSTIAEKVKWKMWVLVCLIQDGSNIAWD